VYISKQPKLEGELIQNGPYAVVMVSKAMCPLIGLKSAGGLHCCVSITLDRSLSVPTLCLLNIFASGCYSPVRFGDMTYLFVMQIATNNRPRSPSSWLLRPLSQAPTRELAQQISGEIDKLGRGMGKSCAGSELGKKDELVVCLGGKEDGSSPFPPRLSRLIGFENLDAAFGGPMQLRLD